MLEISYNRSYLHITDGVILPRLTSNILNDYCPTKLQLECEIRSRLPLTARNPAQFPLIRISIHQAARNHALPGMQQLSGHFH